MIDFAKTVVLPDNVQIDHNSIWSVGNHEDGYLIGINNLISIFEEITASREAAANSVIDLDSTELTLCDSANITLCGSTAELDSLDLQSMNELKNDQLKLNRRETEFSESSTSANDEQIGQTTDRIKSMSLTEN